MDEGGVRGGRWRGGLDGESLCRISHDGFKNIKCPLSLNPSSPMLPLRPTNVACRF